MENRNYRIKNITQQKFLDEAKTVPKNNCDFKLLFQQLLDLFY